MKVLFLDFDGVLAPGLIRKLGPDPRCVGVLNNVLGDTGAAIVVSSAWRTGRSPDFLAGQLDMMGVKVDPPGPGGMHLPGMYPHRVVGVTDERGPTRGAEIVRWMGVWHRSVEGWAVVDDWDDAGRTLPDAPFDPRLTRRFVQTRTDMGLTKDKGGRLTKLLNAR